MSSLEIDEATARIAQAQADLEKAQRRRTERKEAPEAQLERILRETADANAIADAEAEHGAVGESIGTIETRGGTIIVKRPNEALWRRCSVDAGSKNAQKAEAAAERLIKECLVHPPRAAYVALVERYPAASAAVVNMIVKLASGGADLSGE